MTPARQVMHWFAPEHGIEPFLPERFPIWIWEPPDDAAVGYGFPALDGPAGGVKVAIHHGGSDADPETVDREVREEDVEAMRACLRDRLPGAAGRWLHGSVCLYTNTPDHDFIVDHHPSSARVHVVAGLSGHGFKFAPVIGEIVADMVTQGGTVLPIGPFSATREATPDA